MLREVLGALNGHTPSHTLRAFQFSRHMFCSRSARRYAHVLVWTQPATNVRPAETGRLAQNGREHEMNNVQTVADLVDIAASLDPRFDKAVNTLIDLSDSLYGAAFNFAGTDSPTERAQCASTFAQAVYELEHVLAYLQGYQKRIRAGVWSAERSVHDAKGVEVEPSRVIPLRRRQPRDARGRFVKIAATSAQEPSQN